LVAPSGPVYQAGTLSGNPLAMAAGFKTLSILKTQKKKIYKQLEERSAQWENGFESVIKKYKLPLTQNRVGSMFTLFFTKENVTDYSSAKTSETKKFAQYFNAMLERGVYLAPSQFEAAFMSTAHTKAYVDRTLNAAEESLQEVFSFGS
jgi:glutamate-1-semialdehyde 2,1-aminomutase